MPDERQVNLLGSRATNSPVPVALWPDIGHVQDPEDLAAWGAEVGVAAARVAERWDARLANALLTTRQVGRSELDPGTTRSRRVVDRLRVRLRREFAELDAEAATVAERDKQDRMGQTDVALHHPATENVSEERGEGRAILRPNEEMDACAQAHDREVAHVRCLAAHELATGFTGPFRLATSATTSGQWRQS